MIQDARITVGVTGDGALKVLYAGNDAAKAETSFSAAGVEYAEVGVIAHTQPVFTRYPKQEAEDAANAAKESALREAAERNRVKLAAEAKLAQAAKLTSEAKALNETIAPKPAK